MRPADRLLKRSLGTLLGATVAWVLLGLVAPLGIQYAQTMGYVVLLGTAFALADRHPRVAAALVLGLGIPMVSVQVLATGGPTSMFVAYFPLCAMVTWSWLGRRWGVVAAGALMGVLVVGWWQSEPQAPSVTQEAAAFVSALVIGCAFLFAVTRELRLAAQAAWNHAAEAEHAASLAAEAEEARNRFLAAVSHELRTPLDAVLGYAELLREEEVDADRQIDLDRIHAAGRQLQSLVDDLLEIAHTPTSQLEVAFAAFDVAALVDEVVATLGPMASARKDEVVRRLDPVGPFCSDRRRVRQILLNLLSNAIKYTNGGRIEIAVEQWGHEIVWTVADSGIGIPKDRLPQLFQPFVQLHDGPARQPGVGLGLALSQRLAERLGGRIEADSTAGVGSTFRLRLPVFPLADG